MSARGVKGSSALGGGSSDGNDFQHRQTLAPRYERMAQHRQQLVQLFNYAPYFYAVSVVLAALHYRTALLAPISATFLPPFWLFIVGMLVTGALNLASMRKQSDLALMVGSALSTLFVVYITVLYVFQCLFPDVSKHEEVGFAWYGLGAVLNGLLVLLNVYGVFNAHMIRVLQGQKK